MPRRRQKIVYPSQAGVPYTGQRPSLPFLCVDAETKAHPGDESSGVNTFCDVALRLPPRQWFTYRIPDSLQTYIRPGMRVTVPLRRVTVVGIVGRCHSRNPEVAVKDVVDVIDDVPWFDSDLLKLADWISEYYFCAPGEALFAMLPGGLRASVDTVYHHQSERMRTTGLGPAEKRVCLYVADHPGALRAELLLKFPQSGTVKRLEKLVKQGSLSLRRRVRSSKIKSLSNKAVEWIGPRSGDEFKGDALATHLINSAAPVSARSIRHKFPKAPGQLLRLARRNCVRTVEVPTPYEPTMQRVSQQADLELTSHQDSALRTISKAVGSHQTFLLYGVTGSGKTEVYIRAIRSTLEMGKSALFLVPEIGLANMLLERLAAHFYSRVVVLHSGLTQRERALAWRAVHRGERTLVVGTRSAVLAPLNNLGIIIVDEEQDASYKQESPVPRYHARDVAIWRAREAGAICVLGTATPSLESWHNAASGKFVRLDLPTRIEGRELPRLHLVNLRNRSDPESLLTSTLEHRIRATIDNGGQAILFLNRRGYSGALRCGLCGEVCPCPDCSVAYSYHRDRRQLRCHFCGRHQAAPKTCEACGGDRFLFLRAGTQRVEDELAERFPAARIARLDLDVATKRGGAAAVLERFGRGELDILLGTQMITKGLHFPRVSLVGILNTDMGLDMPDFRATERTVQQVLQVAGRAGRGDIAGSVYVQTVQPEQPVFRFLESGDYSSFVAAELTVRKAHQYPPFTRLIQILALAREEAVAEDAMKVFVDRLSSSPRGLFKRVGPAPAPLKRLRQQYRWQLILKTSRVKATLRTIEKAMAELNKGSVRFNINVDPVQLL